VTVPFLNLALQHRTLRAEILAAWERVLDSTSFVSGGEVRAFEEEFAERHGVQHCIAVSSGTDALVLALRAAGVRPGERVALPANTFIATAEAVSTIGAVPHLVDCNDATATIDVDQVTKALADGVRGVLPVHLYGQPADVDPLRSAADANGAVVIEDAAQAHLATYQGRYAGGLAGAAAFSFYPGKNLGATGEGGAVTTNDDEIARQVRMLRDHGQSEKYRSDVIGYNARMSELIAAALRIKLRHLPGWTEARRAAARHYRRLLADVPGVRLQEEPAWASSSYHLFVVRVADRDAVRAKLERAGISTGLHYPVPVHLQKAYASLGHRRGDFPVAESWADQGISLPMFPELSEAQVERVVEALAAAVV